MGCGSTVTQVTRWAYHAITSTIAKLTKPIHSPVYPSIPPFNKSTNSVIFLRSVRVVFRNPLAYCTCLEAATIQWSPDEGPSNVRTRSRRMVASAAVVRRHSQKGREKKWTHLTGNRRRVNRNAERANIEESLCSRISRQWFGARVSRAAFLTLHMKGARSIKFVKFNERQ